MRFDVIIGNPPYQLGSDGGTRDVPIYQHFMKHTPGLASGGIICGYLIGFIDIRHGGKDGSERKDKTLREMRDPAATKLSHIVRYCGYAGGTDTHGHQTGRMERPQQAHLHGLPEGARQQGRQGCPPKIRFRERQVCPGRARQYQPPGQV